MTPRQVSAFWKGSTNLREEMLMKKYMKPSLKGLGLLRVVTKFSVHDGICPPGEFYSNGECRFLP
jgi:hypothetical protein